MSSAPPWEKYQKKDDGDRPPWERYASRSAPAHPEARLSAGEPESAFAKAARAVKEAVIGAPEREEAKQAGLYQTPTPFDMAKAGAAGAAAMAGGGMLGQVAAAPMAAVSNLALGTGGAIVGKHVGRELGGLGETIGFPKGTRQALETGGALVGGIAGPIGGPKVAADLMRLAPHSRAATLARYFMGSEPAAAVATADPLMGAAQSLAKGKTFPDAATALSWLKSLRPEQQSAVLQQIEGAAAPVAAVTRAPIPFPANPAQAAARMAPAEAPTALESQLQQSLSAAKSGAPMRVPPLNPSNVEQRVVQMATEQGFSKSQIVNTLKEAGFNQDKGMARGLVDLIFQKHGIAR